MTPRDHGPAGTLGFFATLAGRPIPRELIPLAGPPGTRVLMHLRDLGLEATASAVVSRAGRGRRGNLGPAATTTVRFLGNPGGSLPGSAPEIVRLPATIPLPRLGAGEVAVIDELDKVHPQTGECIPPQPPDYFRANHLWNAAERRISLYAARNEFVAFQVLIQGRQLGRDVGPAAGTGLQRAARCRDPGDHRALSSGANAGGPLARSHRSAGRAGSSTAGRCRRPSRAG